MTVVVSWVRQFRSAFNQAPPLVRLVSVLLVVVGALLVYRAVLQVYWGLRVTLDGQFMPGMTEVVFAVFPVLVAALTARAAFFLAQARPGSRVGAMIQAGFGAFFGLIGGPLLVVPIAIAALLVCLAPPVKSWSS